MTAKPEAYRGSSLGRYAMPGSGEMWVITREVLKRFGGSRKAYLEYVYEGIGRPWKPTAVNRLFIPLLLIQLGLRLQKNPPQPESSA